MQNETVGEWNVRFSGWVRMFDIVRPLGSGGENYYGAFVALSEDNCRAIDLSRCESYGEIGARLAKGPACSARNREKVIQQLTVWEPLTQVVHLSDPALMPATTADIDLVNALKVARRDVRRWTILGTSVTVLALVDALCHLIF